MPSKSWYVKENKPSVTICVLSLIIVGIVMIFAGGLVTYIYFTEITPPNYDAYYQRYVGSSFPRIVGIIVLMAGLTIFWGASIFLVYVNWRESSESPPEEPTVEYYFDDISPDPSPVDIISRRTHHKERHQPRENYIA